MTQRVSELLNKADKSLSAGRISEAYHIWNEINPTQITTQAQKVKYDFIFIATAHYGQGDIQAALKYSRELNSHENATLRYRFAFEQRDWRGCKIIRRNRKITNREIDDFRCSAGIRLLWRHRYQSAFPFYRFRTQAINFPAILPQGLRHEPLPDNPADDLDHIVLEQGVGDILFDLAHIHQMRAQDKITFIGQLRYQQLVQRLFPNAEFLDISKASATISGQSVHMAMDYLARALNHEKTGFIPTKPLFNLKRNALDPPVFGICWRGGSGQNRREERDIPLPLFLDLLPRGAKYLALQFDITEQEKSILMRDGRCFLPFTQLTGNALTTAEMIGKLAGVISLDSANLHFAGITGVPGMALMNKTPHWYWGQQAEVKSVYPSIQTIAKTEMNPLSLQPFIDDATRAYETRPIDAPQIVEKNGFEQPLFILGLPRSGTSMTSEILAAHGIWLGETVPGSYANPRGFFENIQLKDVYVKGILKDLGADPNGVLQLPRDDYFPPFPGLAYQFRKTIHKQGYVGGTPWGFKDPKITLIWPLLAKSFPNARWLIISRNESDVIASYRKVHFLARHSKSDEYWKMFNQAYQRRLMRLQNEKNVFHVQAEDIMAGRYDDLETLLGEYGLRFDAKRADEIVQRDVNHSGPKG